MSEVTDWLGAIGSVVGAVGGLAGFYALHIQRQDAKRRSQAPPGGVAEHALTLLDAARRVLARGPQRGAYFQHEEYSRAYRELQRLVPAVRQAELVAAIKRLLEDWVTLATSGSRHASGTGVGPHPDKSGRTWEPEEQTRRLQLVHAEQVVAQAELVLREFEKFR